MASHPKEEAFEEDARLRVDQDQHGGKTFDRPSMQTPSALRGLLADWRSELLQDLSIRVKHDRSLNRESREHEPLAAHRAIPGLRGRGLQVVEITQEPVFTPTPDKGDRIRVLTRRVARHELQVFRRGRNSHLGAPQSECSAL